MKFLVGTSILLFGLVNIVSSTNVTEENIVSPSNSTEDILEEVHQYYNDIESCKNETGATESDVTLALQNMLPTTKTAKCLDACLFKKQGVMDEEKFIPDKFKDKIRKQNSTLRGSNGESLTDVADDLVKECGVQTDPDKCELAAKIRICLNDVVRRLGFWQNLF